MLSSKTESISAHPLSSLLYRGSMTLQSQPRLSHASGSLQCFCETLSYRRKDIHKGMQSTRCDDPLLRRRGSQAFLGLTRMNSLASPRFSAYSEKSRRLLRFICTRSSSLDCPESISGRSPSLSLSKASVSLLAMRADCSAAGAVPTEPFSCASGICSLSRLPCSAPPSAGMIGGLAGELTVAKSPSVQSRHSCGAPQGRPPAGT